MATAGLAVSGILVLHSAAQKDQAIWHAVSRVSTTIKPQILTSFSPCAC